MFQDHDDTPAATLIPASERLRIRSGQLARTERENPAALDLREPDELLEELSLYDPDDEINF